MSFDWNLIPTCPECGNWPLYCECEEIRYMASLRKRAEVVYRAGAHIRHGTIESETGEHAIVQKDDGKYVLIPQEDIAVKRLP